MNMKDVFQMVLRPVILIAGVVLFLVIVIVAVSNAIFGADEHLATYGGAVSCTEGKINHKRINEVLSNAGVFAGKTDLFIDAAERHQIDPVLLIAIALHETGYGTSSAVKKLNNPGGLINPRTDKLFAYDSLEEGINAMASNLYRLYISQGLLTIEQIGHKYAPIGAKNDPRNLNIHWIPAVKSIVSELGGLSMNCELIGTGEFVFPTLKPLITSNYGYRYHPKTGIYHFHKGIDFGCSYGEPIMAVDHGKVVVAHKTGYNGGYGHHIIIDHGDKYTLYAHLAHVNVALNDIVSQGEKIGTCGSTGDSTGPHLHFEVQYGQIYGERVDPLPFFQSNKEEDI